MTTATLYTNGERLDGFLVQGHAGYADKGQDIVCAAVSALVQTTVLGLTEVVRCRAAVSQDDAAGKLSCRLPEDAGHDAQILLRTLEQGLTSIYRAYPGFVRIIYRERR